MGAKFVYISKTEQKAKFVYNELSEMPIDSQTVSHTEVSNASH